MSPLVSRRWSANSQSSQPINPKTWTASNPPTSNSTPAPVTPPTNSPPTTVPSNPIVNGGFYGPSNGFAPAPGTISAPTNGPANPWAKSPLAPVVDVPVVNKLPQPNNSFV